MERLLPAYPLFVNDPYFSLWIDKEDFNMANTHFWTGAKSNLYGLVKTKKCVYSFLGVNSKAIALKQTKLSLTAFSTDCQFECDEFTLLVSFISPLLPTDLKLMSRPVCYLKYEIISKTADNNFEIMLAANENICYENCGQMRGGAIKMDDYNIAWFGLREQRPLSSAGDATKCDWGNYYIIGQNARFLPLWEIDGYGSGDRELEYCYVDDAPRAICAYDKFSGSGKGKLMIAYDDTVSIFYFGDFLRGYYFNEGLTIFDAIQEAYNDFDEIIVRLNAFDTKLKAEASHFGDKYLNILYASLRQSIAAHKLCKDKNGNILFLSKECNSNGCIATVDVSYPSMPLFLKYNPNLLLGMLTPIFKFAKMPVWEYDFAPHDVGTYPYCSGQSYSINGENNERHENICRKKFEACAPLYNLPKGCDVYSSYSQMPLEECANMLIMSLATVKFGGDDKFLSENFELLQKWADYLRDNALSSQEQLCTDDFAGHLAANINLSIKAVVGIGAFAQICKLLKFDTLFDVYHDAAKKLSSDITSRYKDNSHLPLTFFSDKDTYSIKYNFAFDVLLELNLFDKDLLEKEVDNLLFHSTSIGFPLDNRKRYTKCDWIIWCLAITTHKEKQDKIIAMIDNYLKTSPSRVPFGDWYDCDNGVYLEFRNRTVVGASFIALLSNSGKKNNG